MTPTAWKLIVFCAPALWTASASAAVPLTRTEGGSLVQENADKGLTIPNVVTEGALEDRFASCKGWLKALGLADPQSSAHRASVRKNFDPWTFLNFDLSSAGRLGECVELCELLHAALPDSSFRKQKVVFQWARLELLRDRRVRSGELLDEHLRIQQAWQHPDKYARFVAREKAYYFIGRSDLALSLGLMDRAYEYMVAAEVEWEAVVRQSSSYSVRGIRAELDQIAVDVALGMGDAALGLSLVTRKLEALEAEFRGLESPTQKDRRFRRLWDRHFRVREASALYVLALRDAVPRERALQSLTRIVEHQESSAVERFHASLHLWEIHLIDGDLGLAAVEAKRARSMEQTPARLAGVRSLELTQATLEAGPIDAELQAFVRWREAFDSMIESSLNDPPRAAGSGYMAIARRRVVLWAGLNSLVGRGQLEEAFDLYLETERIGSLSRLLRGVGSTETLLTTGSVRDSLLTEGEVVLVPMLFTHGGLLFVLGQDELQCLAIEEGGDSYRLSRQVESTVSVPAPDGADLGQREEAILKMGRELRRLLLPDAALDACLGASLVTVVDDHVQGRVPLDLIAVQGQLLSTLVPMAEVASLDVLASLKRREVRERPKSISLVANVPAKDALEGATETALLPFILGPAAIERLVPSHSTVSSQVFEGMDATEERVRASVLSSAPVVTFVAHGFPDYRQERPATLWLGTDGAGDGLLSAEEIEGTGGAADVVVLATCGAASGALRAGDAGAGHLGGALTMAGARAVVLASGALPVAATLQAIECIHDYLMGGASVADAVHRARVDLAADPAFQDPSTYAQLRVYGQGAYVPFPQLARSGRGTPVIRWAVLAAAAVTLAALVLVFRRRRSSDL